MKKKNTKRRRVFVSGPLGHEPWITAAAVMTSVLPAIHGQEALRYSIPNTSVDNTPPVAIEEQPYTVKAGDFRMLLAPTLGLAWNDNVYTEHRNAKDDFILTPLMDAQMSYPLTAHNQLSLNLGVGYEKYFTHDELSTWLVRSGSQLAFDAYIKDVWLNVHDRFEYIRDSAHEAAVANTANFGNFDNLAGLLATWNLKDVVLSAGYDHQTVFSPSSEFENQDRSSELFIGRAGFRVHPQVVVGVEGTGALTSYDHPVLNDNTSYSAGGYGTLRMGTSLQFSSRAGYAAYLFDHTSGTIQTSDVNSWYGDLTVRHEVSDAISYSLSGGHEVRLGVEADMIEDYYVRPQINWNFAKDWSMGVSFSYEHGRQGVGNVSGNLTETYDWCGTEFLLSHWILKRLRADFGYRPTIRDSTVTDRQYTQNLLHLNLTYQFR